MVDAIPAEVLFDFGVVAGPLSQVPGWIALFFYARYDIDRARHAEIRRELDARGATSDSS